MIKRIIDVSISTAALILLAIPGGIIALAIKMTSPGPVFYRCLLYTSDAADE